MIGKPPAQYLAHHRLTCSSRRWGRARSQRGDLPARRYQDQAAGAESSPGAARVPRHLWCVRHRLELGRRIDGRTATVRSVWLHDGVRGFYRGLGPTILGYLPTWAIYFAVYDGIKTAFGEAPLGALATTQEDRLYPAAQPKGYQPVMREHPWSLHILSAMSAGAASTICTNPLWVIKTRFMVRHVGKALGIGSLILQLDPIPRGSPIQTYT